MLYDLFVKNHDRTCLSGLVLAANENSLWRIHHVPLGCGEEVSTSVHMEHPNAAAELFTSSLPYSFFYYDDDRLSRNAKMPQRGSA